MTTVESLSYVQWDCIFLCFDIGEKQSPGTLAKWVGHHMPLLVDASKDVSRLTASRSSGLVL